MSKHSRIKALEERVGQLEKQLSEQTIEERVYDWLNWPNIGSNVACPTIGGKVNAILDYLKLKVEATPETSLPASVKAKPRVARAATKPKKQTKGKRVSP